jgi:hypothetical protein
MNTFKVGDRFIVVSSGHTAARLGLPPNTQRIITSKTVLTIRQIEIGRIQAQDSFWWALEDVRPAALQIPTKGLAYQVYLQEEMSKC